MSSQGKKIQRSNRLGQGRLQTGWERESVNEKVLGRLQAIL